jgi:glycolate oxidase FAD binding subunit
MPPIPSAIEHELASILATDAIRAAGPADAVGGVQPRLVLEPADERQLAAVLRLANDAGLAVVPRGGGTKLSWGNPPQRADVILSTARLTKIIEHVWADLTVSVEAGCTVGNLQAALAKHGQRLAIDTLWPERATIGGILSTNDSGALRLRFGPLRDLIIGATIALPDGTLASSGGKVVKNVAGYDLPKLVTGALGTLGVITRAVFRLHPLPQHSATVSFVAPSLDAAQRLVQLLQDSNLAHTSLQMRAAVKTDPAVDILFEGTEEGIAAQIAQAKSLAGIAPDANPSAGTWKASQNLWDSLDSSVIAKISSLPASIARTVEIVQRVTGRQKIEWQLVMQTIGVGCLRLDGAPQNLHACLSEIRSEVEKAAGSLVIRHRPAGMPPLDAWGNGGDALPLMRAIKAQFDPKNTLNLGRFVGGI